MSSIILAIKTVCQHCSFALIHKIRPKSGNPSKNFAGARFGQICQKCPDVDLLELATISDTLLA